MLTELKRIVNVVRDLSEMDKVEFVSKDELRDMAEYVEEFQEDIDNLQKVLDEIESSKLNKNKKIELAIARLNESLVRIIEDVESVFDLVTLFAQRYVQSLDANKD